MKYSEIIGVEKHFKSAFDITSDSGGAWKTFISNERFEGKLKHHRFLIIENLYGFRELTGQVRVIRCLSSNTCSAMTTMKSKTIFLKLVEAN